MTVQVYLDTSALVKRYVAETGSKDVAELLKNSEYRADSIVTEAEFPAALGKAWRTGGITKRDAQAYFALGKKTEKNFCGSSFHRTRPDMAASWPGKMVCGDTMRSIWRRRYGGKPILGSRSWWRPMIENYGGRPRSTVWVSFRAKSPENRLADRSCLWLTNACS